MPNERENSLENKDLEDQLAGLFSDTTELIDPTSNNKTIEKRKGASPRKQGEATLFRANKKPSVVSNHPPLSKTEQPQPIIDPHQEFDRPTAVINWRLLIWAVLVTLAVIMFATYGQAIFSPNITAQATPFQIVAIELPSPTPTVTSTSTPITLLDPSSTPLSFAGPTQTATPIAPNGRTLILTPDASNVGWVVSNDNRIVTADDPHNRFGDSYLYAGVLDGEVYYGAIQFDLRQIPRGTEVYAATLRLIGLRADQLGQNPEGRWQLHLLDSNIDERWSQHNYQQIRRAKSSYIFEPSLSHADLAQNVSNVFEFDEEALALLEQRILEGGNNFGRKVSFRLVGPTNGPDNLFAWDSGYGPASTEAKPELFLSIGSPPEATPPPYYVLITSTPTPKSIETAVALSLQMTAQATKIGTSTPLPGNWVTPFAVTSTPTAANNATAQAHSSLATAIALTTGEPPNLVTTTPTPTYVIITSTPTAESIETAVAQALAVTSQAVRYGTVTPIPENWVTPVVVTVTPTPENTATVNYHQAVALTTGTPTPIPGNVQTATPTPVMIAADPLAVPTETATPSPTPQVVPNSLLGKVIFLSDREGDTETERERADHLKSDPEIIPQPYVYDPATGELARLTNIWPYEVSQAREGWSADLNFETYTQALLWTNVRTSQGNIATEVFAIHYYDHNYNIERAVTNFGSGIAYDAVWSPTSNEIALVATESGNDEIWIINHDGTDPRQLTRNSWEWDKHPTWSPDGQQIVFYSNRTGNSQLWIMNKDGSDQRLLMDSNPYNDFDPVWVKYLEPAPDLERLPDWRFIKPENEQ